MPNMLAHRRVEADYYKALVGELAAAAELSLELCDNPHRWEGMADVAAVGDRVVLTYAVPGHYDRDTAPKSSRRTARASNRPRPRTERRTCSGNDPSRPPRHRRPHPRRPGAPRTGSAPR
jgi:hypothetical protein